MHSALLLSRCIPLNSYVLREALVTAADPDNRLVVGWSADDGLLDSITTSDNLLSNDFREQNDDGRAEFSSFGQRLNAGKQSMKV